MRVRSKCKECASVYIGRTLAKYEDEQNWCDGTVTDFKACKYLVCYKDGTTATLTKTALMKVLSPVRVETTAAAAISTIVEDEAVDSPFRPETEPTEASTETSRMTAVQKSPAGTGSIHQTSIIKNICDQVAEPTRPVARGCSQDATKKHPAATVQHTSGSYTNSEVRRAVPRRGIV